MPARSHPNAGSGENVFRLEKTEYGQRYSISILLPLANDRRLEAELEWLLIEADLRPDGFGFEAGHSWNMVASRSDVTGRITVCDPSGSETERRQFRGTGYHDHNLDNRWLAKTVRDWHWGTRPFCGRNGGLLSILRAGRRQSEHETLCHSGR